MKTQQDPSLGKEFVEELIRLFFNPKSYFYNSFASIIEAQKRLSGEEASRTELIADFFSLLSKSNDPIGVLKEVSHFDGLEDFYSDLREELLSIRKFHPDQIDTKNFIANLAKTTYEKLSSRLANTALQKYLRTYIKLKESLLDLIENTNGSDTYLEAGNIKALLSEPNSVAFFEDSSFSANDEEKQEKENIRFRKFFEEELTHIFEPLLVEFQEIQTKNKVSDYLQSAREIFEKVLELAKFHDYSSVKQVSEETLLFLEKISDPLHGFTMNDYNLLQAAHAHIIKSVVKPNSNGLHEFLHTLRHGKANTSPAKNDSDEKKEDSSTGQHVEYNTLLGKQQIESEASKEDNEEADKKEPLLPEDDQIQFSLPGESNEELLNLIKDVSLSVNIPAKTEAAQEEPKDDTKKPQSSTIDYQTLKDVGEREAYHTFATQAKPMAQIIFDSLNLLKQDNIKYAHIVEDIELASASLKHLARKLNLQKLAFFPELVESICINVSAADLKIPAGFLDAIAKGVKHLLAYDPANENHEAILIDILSDLKRYYAHTVKIIEQTQLASS